MEVRGLRETGRHGQDDSRVRTADLIFFSIFSPTAQSSCLWLLGWCFGERPKSPFSSHPQEERAAARALLTARRSATVARRSPASRCNGKELSWPGGQGTSGPWVPERTFAKLFSARSCRGGDKEKRTAERRDRGGTNAQLRSHGLLNLGEREPRSPGAPSLSQRRRGQSSESGRRRVAAGRPTAGSALSASSGRPTVAGK